MTKTFTECIFVPSSQKVLWSS